MKEHWHLCQHCRSFMSHNQKSYIQVEKYQCTHYCIFQYMTHFSPSEVCPRIILFMSRVWEVNAVNIYLWNHGVFYVHCCRVIMGSIFWEWKILKCVERWHHLIRIAGKTLTHINFGFFEINAYDCGSLLPTVHECGGMKEAKGRFRRRRNYCRSLGSVC
jgi:hypothetical protein